MKLQLSTSSRIVMAAAVGIIATMGVLAVRGRADVWDKKTILTVHQPIQVEETYLEPGTYVLKLHNSSSNRNIVHIFNENQDQVINTILAIPNYRLQPTGDSRFAFYETPPGTARAMRAWFYPGDNFGQEFRYPKHLRTVQVAMAAPVTRPPEPPPPPIVTQPAEPEPTRAEPPKREEPEQIAQAKPPAQPEPAPAPPPEPAKKEEPAELPKTGTWFPLIGLGGLLSLAAYGLLRINRMT